MGRAALALVTVALAASCGPMTVENAERECFQRARLAAGPRGSVAVGVGSDGHAHAGLSVSISSNYIQGRDPSDVYNACVVQKSGQPPSRPLYTRPDWKA